jgi:heme A synthase
VHVQVTHRVLAVLVVLHLLGLAIGFTRRREPAVVRRVAVIAASLAVLQLLVAGAMIGLRLPPVLRSLHEATGVSIWIAAFTLAYLARLASGDRSSGAAATAPADASGAAGAAPDRPVLRTTTMGHTVAVIVARGAES